MKPTTVNKLIFPMRNSSLRQRTLWAMALLLLAFGMIFGVIYTSMVQSLTEEREKSAVKLTINNALSNIHSLVDSYSDMSRLIMLNSDVTEFLSAPVTSSHMVSKARTGIYSITTIYNNVDSVYLFRLDGESVSAARA